MLKEASDIFRHASVFKTRVSTRQRFGNARFDTRVYVLKRTFLPI